MKKVLITLTVIFLIFFLNMCIRYTPENHYILVSDNQVTEKEKNIYESLKLKSIRLSEEQSLFFWILWWLKKWFRFNKSRNTLWEQNYRYYKYKQKNK